MGPVTECYRCDRAPCSTWNGRPVCGDCLDYYREGAAPFPDESAGSESIASGGSDRHDENSAPAAGSREAATDPPTGLTNPTPDASSSPVPVPVVNEVAEAAAKAMNLEAGRQRGLTLEDDWKTITEQERGGWRLVAHSVLALPEFRAAFEAQAKLAELQAAPSSSKDLELAEAQAKLEALLAGEGDLPEGWTEEWRAASEHYHGIWMTRPGANAASTRIAGGWLERRICSPAVRVEEGGEGS